jgi:hypothetical protein
VLAKLRARSNTRRIIAVGLLVCVCTLIYLISAFLPAGSASAAVSDRFDRADGGLGEDWADMSDGGMVISSHMATGTANGYSGAIRGSEAYSSDQYSQIDITSTGLTGRESVGVVVRAQNRGQDLYLGLYSWNYGKPCLMLYRRIGGRWTQLGDSHSFGAPAAGTRLRLSVVGSALSLSANGAVSIAAEDISLNGGAPGVMAYGAAQGNNWRGGDLGFRYVSTDSKGVEFYRVASPDNGDRDEIVRVLRPTHPAPGVAHNFLYLLPVEAGLKHTYGDGMATIEAMDAQDKYNLTVVEPSFGAWPWYANNPTNAGMQYETFITTQLRPWVKANLSTTGAEQHWLLGFSKSGVGGQDLILKHPDLFTLAASWDFPADMSSYRQYGASSAYGTEANFEENYQLTRSFVAARKGPFLTSNRIWLGGHKVFTADMLDYDALLTSEGIKHTMGVWQPVAHRWDSGWVPYALAGLYQDSLKLPPPS